MSEVVNQDTSVKEDVVAFEAKAGTVAMVPLALIRKSDVALRDVQRDNENFLHLVQSVRQHGILNSILVREQLDPNGTKTYGLVDGLQRFTAATEAGLVEIPARIVAMDDAELLEAQIITNVNRIETKPAQYSEHLVRILGRNPFMTRQQLAEKLCQSTAWIDERLSLVKLDPEIAKLVDAGRINLTNAYALAKLPADEQAKNVDAAMTEQHNTFVLRMKQRVKEIREAKKTGRDASASEFQPVQYMQKIGDVKTEMSAGVIRDTLLAQAGLNSEDAKKAWALCLNWILHFDDASKAAQKAKHDERETARKAAAEQRKVERESKKKEEAAQKAASIEQGW